MPFTSSTDRYRSMRYRRVGGSQGLTAVPTALDAKDEQMTEVVQRERRTSSGLRWTADLPLGGADESTAIN